MQGGPNANNLAFIEYDPVIINADHGPELVIEELLSAVLDVFRESDPVADGQRDLLLLEHTGFTCLLEWKLLLTPSFPTMADPSAPAKDLPLFVALKALS
jgi:hypothetical protein